MAIDWEYYKKKAKKIDEENYRKNASNDIAPVRTQTPILETKNNTESKWFQKSALFDDGYQFGDIGKAILGSTADVGENAGTGLIGMGEKALDALLQLGAVMSKNQMNENAQNEMIFNTLTGKKTDGILENWDSYQKKVEEETSEFVKKDLYDEAEIAKKIIRNPFEKVTGLNVETDSVFGEKSDAVAQSGGQLLGTVALNAVGVPWYLTTGITSFGSQAETALNEGASFDEANASALITAGAEILTEKLSGGIKFGGKAIDDVLLDTITKNISNKAIKGLVNVGFNAFGEGAEEVVSGVLSNLGTALYKEEDLKDILASEEAFDEYLESFIGGAALGGVSSSVREIKNRNVTKLTETEKSVVDKVVEDRIADEEQNGKKLSNKEKNKIYDEVVRDLGKGYISTDKIEEVLGGEDYTNYKNAFDNETALKEEFNKLNQMRQSEMTGEQIDRRAELKQQLEELKENSSATQFKSKLNENVLGIVKGSKLQESYNEKTKRGQRFEADLSKYDKKYQETIQKAVDSGILNNTNRTHDFVDMVTKISADTGVLFDFTNNEKIKTSGFAIEGKQVNGFVRGNNISINIDSTSALNKVVGHEITHVLEGTELYTELANAVKELATTKGEYDSKLQSIAKLYEGMENVNIENELTADLIGEYLFTDTDFINSLSAEKPTLFQKIFDEIKYLCKVATAGSKEAKQLEKVKKAFEDAYRADNRQKNNTDTDDGVKYSLTNNSNDSKAVVKIINENISKVSNESHFSVVSEKLPDEVRPSEYILNIFNEQGGVAINSELGKVELNRSGAKSTALHGFGNNKIAAVKAIRNVIENGNIINKTLNYKGTDVDRYTIAARGTIDGKSAIVGVVVKAYPKNKSSNAKFYLHEAIITETDSPFRTAPQLSVDTVSESVSNDIISNPKENVKDVFGYKINQGTEVNEDLLEDMSYYHPDAEVDTQGNITVYHQTTKANADKIKQTGVMTAKEDALFFSSKENGYASDYGDTVVKMKIPSTELRLNDVFDGEVHFDLPLKYKNGGYSLDISKYLVDDTKISLSNANEDIAPVGNNFYGGDIKLQTASAEDIGPVREDVQDEKKSTIDVPDLFVKPAKSGNTQSAPEDLGPVREDIKSAEITETVAEKPKSKRLERAIRKIDTQLELDKANLSEDFQQKKAELEKALENKTTYISDKSLSLYKELQNLRKGVRASNDLAYFLDLGYEWKDLKSTLLKVHKWPDTVLNPDSEIESTVREAISRDFENKSYELDDLDTEYQKQLENLEKKAEEKRKKAGIAEQRRVKVQEYRTQMDELIGDTSTWKDKKLGVQYRINTLRRNLRDIVRDKSGKRDLAKADVIYDELQGRYNHNEAELNREANRIKKVYVDMKINKVEDQYIQMLGEYRHNPDTKLTLEEMQEFLEKNRDKIDEAKVDKAIDLARETYDNLFGRVNAVLKEQGMREIPYRLGYFPHFTEEKQGRLAKLLNWKTHKTDIPTDIAGLTEQFNPNRSWQSFNKRRTGDDTDYSFKKGLDTYVQGALDWIYHIEDIQKRRAFENHIRYVHSEKGIQEKIDAIHNNEEYDVDEMQEQIDAVFKEAGNPLNNFITDFRTQTNTLAGKKSSMDRNMEAMLNRDVYSTMTNISNRVTANMVVGSVSSALTNFIPITQSWGEVSPISSITAMKDTIKSAVRDDGTIDKSDFLTNRLKKSENLYQTTWDKVIDKAGAMMEIIDSFTSQTVWRSKYLENISNGMSENAAIKNADQFAENVLAGRSRGNNPTIFDSKNPLIKTMTAFQLEVNNQYGYMFKDMPQDLKKETVGKLVKGYATMFIGAHAYNALYSSLTGRNAAFDPIGILEDLLRDIFGNDDYEEKDPIGIIKDFTGDILDEVPFIGGLLGGGRIPISSALPYSENPIDIVFSTAENLADNDWSTLTEEWLKPLFYLAMPMGGGQIRKTYQGLKMFDKDNIVSGSYTNSGNLRFPVENTLGNKIQAGIFGQYASKNARTYFDEDIAPLNPKQTQEYADLEMPIRDYWNYRKGLKKLGEDATLAEKIDYIADLEEFDTWQKNIMANNLTSRKEPIDLTGYEDIGNFEEFDYATKNPEKYAISKAVGGYENYIKYSECLGNITAEKDKNGNAVSGSRKKKVTRYINNLDIEFGEKMILYRSQYKSDDTYNAQIVVYLNGRNDITHQEKITILTELGFKVSDDGNVRW